MQSADLQEADLQSAILAGANLQGANFKAAKVGSASFRSRTSSNAAIFAFNDFRGIDISILTKKYLEFWKTDIQENLGQTHWLEQLLQSRIGQATAWPTKSVAAPCLADAPRPAPFSSCQDTNTEYFTALANYLGDLACDAKKYKEGQHFPYDDTEGQDFAAGGIARRLRIEYFNEIKVDEWGIEGVAARRQLAQRLLQPICAGKAGLDDDLRAELRKLAEAPEVLSPPSARSIPDTKRPRPDKG